VHSAPRSDYPILFENVIERPGFRACVTWWSRTDAIRLARKDFVNDALMMAVVEKIGIDATVKKRHSSAEFERAWQINWANVRLDDTFDERTRKGHHGVR
jgi:hypothetical protein